MKHLYFIALCIPTILFANETKPIPSTIENVTVFLEGASVERTAQVQLVPGTNELLINQLSPDILEQSIQISGLKETTVLSIKYDVNYLEKKGLSDKFLKFQHTIDSLIANEIRLQNVISGFQEELHILKSNQKINSDATDLSLEKVQQMSGYYRKRTTEIKDEIYNISSKILNIKRQIEDYTHQLKQLKDNQKDKRGNITLKLNSKIATSLTLRVKYNIERAGWFPTYDIRARNTSDPLQFSYKANVFQQSGVDWNNVNIVLSTGDPNLNNTKPIFNTKYLNFVNHYHKKAATTHKEIYKYNPTITRVSGTVYDNAGLPLPGCNVIVKGTLQGTQTDFDGNYTLEMSGGRELVYDYIGFHSYEVPVYSDIMNVNLKEDTHTLNEVVIVGYGGYNRKASKPKDISVVSLLEGKIAGINNSGAPGAANNIKIRGISTLPSKTKPLYIIDGIPVDERELKTLDPSEISDINVLKDAAATTLYGNKASNGVIVISTKQVTGNGTVKETGIATTSFIIDAPYTIRSNQEITILEIDNFTINTVFTHYVAPEINENVFITATIKNWEQFNLLSGDATIYFNGSYAGKSRINPNETSQKLELSLGIDPDVVVKREKLNNFKSTSFLGGNRIVDRGYQIKIKNNKQAPIQLLVEERIPITQNKDIKVTNIETADANYNEQTGKIQWQITLPPKQSIDKTLSFSVKYPKWRKINL